MAADTKQKGKSTRETAGTPLRGGTGALPGATPAQAIQTYMTTPKKRPSLTTVTETPTSDLGSPTPSVMLSAWGLPQNVGALQLPTGTTDPRAATEKDLTSVQRGVAMLSLYGTFASGRKLTPQELKAAQQLGGNVARAAEMVGVGQPAQRQQQPQEIGKVTNTGVLTEEPLKTVPSGTVLTAKGHKAPKAKEPTTPTGENPSFQHPTAQEPAKHGKDTQEAIAAAQAELEQRLHTALGVTPTELTTNAKVPKKLATMMQNAGYGVTQNMTLGKALGVVSGSGPTSTPSSTVTTPVTVAQQIQALMHTTNKTQITSLQNALYQGGFYDEEYTTGKKAVTKGQLTTGTVLAYRSAILQTLTQRAHGKQVTLDQVIQAGDSTNAGVLGTIPVSTTGKTAIEYATPQQMQSTLESAMESYLGRLPTSQELNEFAHYYDQLQQTGNKSLAEEGEDPGGLGYVTYETGVPYMPKVPTPAQAAEQWAQTQNPVAFKAQKVANAYGMLMNLVDRQGESALDTVGTRPTTET